MIIIKIASSNVAADLYAQDETVDGFDLSRRWRVRQIGNETVVYQCSNVGQCGELGGGVKNELDVWSV